MSMTNEDIVNCIQTGSHTKQEKTALMSLLWESVQAFSRMFTYRFCISYSSLCERSGITYDDIYQHSYLTLCAAVEGYRANQNILFLTYYGKAFKHNCLRLCGIGIKRPLNDSISLDTPLSDEHDSNTLIDTISDPEAEDDLNTIPERDYINQLRTDLNICLGYLSENERQLIESRYYEGPMPENLNPHDIKLTLQKAFQKLRGGKSLMLLHKYRTDIISAYAYNSSFSSWRERGESSTEKTAFKLLDIEK